MGGLLEAIAQMLGQFPPTENFKYLWLAFSGLPVAGLDVGDVTFGSGDQLLDIGQGGLARPGDFGEEVFGGAGVVQLLHGLQRD
jgi:hypothetical protein